MKPLKLGLLAAAMLATVAPVADAACPADGATPFFAGPVDPINGFSQYVQDAGGLALAPCLDPAFCVFDPVVPGNAFSEQIGFGAEAFWWLTDTDVVTAGGVDALIVMAAELAFLTDDPADGDQFPFTRLRLRVDIGTPGIYTITHPFGQQTYVLPVAGRRVINDSFDIELTPNATNQGRVSPWLTWDTFPLDPLLDVTGDGIADFVGDAATPHLVQGSPCGNNFFRLQAVALDGVTPLNIDPTDVDGDGRTDRVTQDLFTVSGRVFAGIVATPLSVDGVTYNREPAGNGLLNVFATAPDTAIVSFNVGGPEIAMAGDGLGRFFASIPLTDAPPATVQVTATNPAQPNNVPAVETAAVHDLITVSQASYDNAAKTLTVQAASSDMVTPPTLTVLGFGDVVGGTLMASDLNVAPATVTVQSSAGGSATAPVRVINP